MPARIDLHTHSTASDGTTPPEVLVREAVSVGLDVLAITDHDTTGGWDRAADARPAGLRLVRGAEISCVAEGISLHLLAYLFDPTHAPLADRLAELRDSRDGRARRMVDLLAADGHPVTWEQVSAEADGTVGRPHVARALVASGLVGSVDEAFTPEWIGTRGRYWAPKVDFDVIEAIGLVRDAGGVTVFAHPSAAARGRTVSDDVIRDMAAAGLDGLEVDHVDHTTEARDHLRLLAAELDLLTTGSSDYHGTNKTIPLGANLTDEDVLEQLAVRATGVEVL
jgi:predicted metal-dependent phosphoesterase TrpH